MLCASGWPEICISTSYGFSISTRMTLCINLWNMLISSQDYPWFDLWKSTCALVTKKRKYLWCNWLVPKMYLNYGGGGGRVINNDIIKLVWIWIRKMIQYFRNCTSSYLFLFFRCNSHRCSSNKCRLPLASPINTVLSMTTWLRTKMRSRSKKVTLSSIGNTSTRDGWQERLRELVRRACSHPTMYSLYRVALLCAHLILHNVHLRWKFSVWFFQHKYKW